MTEDTVLEVAVTSATYNIILQVLMRILSSVSNAISLRFITKEALGVINVRLMLLYSTLHFFSREAFRRSCLSKFDVYNFHKKRNLLWLTIPTCLVCSSILGYIWLHLLEKPSQILVPNYSSGVYVVLLCVMIEMFAEPVYVFSQSYHFVKLKVVAEGLALTVKSISMVILLWKWPGQPIQSFCVSQCLYSTIYTLVFYLYFWWYFKRCHKEVTKLPIHSLKGLLPEFSNFFIDQVDLYLTWSFFKQTLLKQLLTEGERYVMTIFNVMSFAEQGLYDVVSNLGSLSARFVFLPVEDSAYLLFTQLMSRDQKANSNENLSKCLRILENLLKLMVLLGLTILAFGYSYSQLLLLLYGGPSLSSSIAVNLLRWHCAYVLFLALNGTSECFKFAVMNNQQLDGYNKNMVFLSSGFLFAAFCLAKIFGGAGFIMANCVNMGLRIIHSSYFINKYFNLSNLYLIKKLIPHPFILIMLAVSISLTSLSEEYFCCDQGVKLWIWHFSLGACCFIIFASSVAWKESEVVKFIMDQWKSKKMSAKKIS